MGHKTRLGPIAIFLTIVVMVVTTLAVLTIATSNADRVMAERFAEVTKTRYELEADGKRFIAKTAGSSAQAGASGETVTGGADASEAVTEVTDRGYRFTEEKNGYQIEAEITEPGEDGSFEILEWRITKIWQADESRGGIWPGF